MHPYILLIFTTAVWGANAIAGRLAVGHIDPQFLTMWRWFGTVLLVGIFAAKYIKNDWPDVMRNWWKFAILGSLGYGGFNLFLYVGLVYTTALNASIIQASIPVLVTIIGALLLKEGVKAGQVVALVIAMLGVAITITRGHPSTLFGMQLNVGDIYLLIASLFYALYSVGLRWRPRVHVFTFLFCAGFFAFLVASSAVTLAVIQDGWKSPTPTGWLIVAFTVIFPSILSQIFYILGVEAIGAARASIFINLIPVFTALLAVIILGEDFKIYHALGFIAVALGIWINEHATKKNTQ